MTKRIVYVNLSKFSINFMHENTHVLNQNISLSTSTLLTQEQEC